MKKEVIQPEEVEVPEGPYSQAIKVRGSNLLFVSGQTPWRQISRKYAFGREGIVSRGYPCGN